MRRKNLFSTAEVWKGGSYDFFIPAESSGDLCSLLRALWTFPYLEGCYLRQDCGPDTQARVKTVRKRYRGMPLFKSSPVLRVPRIVECPHELKIVQRHVIHLSPLSSRASRVREVRCLN